MGAPTPETSRRPLYTWLAELERMRDAAASGARCTSTCADTLEGTAGRIFR